MSILRLKPAVKDYVWGGRRLAEEFRKDCDGAVLAESWELSCHPDGPYHIAGGRYDGYSLPQYLAGEGANALGTNCERFRDFRFSSSSSTPGTISRFRYTPTTGTLCNTKTNMAKRKCGT